MTLYTLPRKPPLLRTPENPDGWRLVELLAQVAREIQQGTDLLVRHETVRDRSVNFIRGNNRRIIENLRLAIVMQELADEETDVLGPTPGPKQISILGPDNWT